MRINFFLLTLLFVNDAYSLDCKNKAAPIPLKGDEAVVVYGDRAIARISKNKWESLHNGTELQIIKTLFDSESGKSLTVDSKTEYDGLEDQCITKAKGNLKEDRFYSTDSKIKFRYKPTEEEKKKWSERCVEECAQAFIIGVSDINKNGFQEVWYQTSKDPCKGIDVMELTPKISALLLTFQYSYECSE